MTVGDWSSGSGSDGLRVALPSCSQLRVPAASHGGVGVAVCAAAHTQHGGVSGSLRDVESSAAMTTAVVVAPLLLEQLLLHHVGRTTLLPD